jgi:hypothetical protein
MHHPSWRGRLLRPAFFVSESREELAGELTKGMALMELMKKARAAAYLVRGAIMLLVIDLEIMKLRS